MSSNTTKARFKYKPLEEITIKIGSGATPKGGKESYQDHGISLIRSLNVYDFFFDYKNLAFIDENQAKKLNNVKIEPQDLLLNITGASVGRCTIVPNSILPARVNQHVSIVRLDLNLADPLYVLYAINSKYFKNSLLKLSETGATREALTKDDISRFCIPVPPLPVQRKIAAVLSAYDDLIENNTRRIALLEKMAEEIYREWFVRLRFPGHEQVTFYKGIPEGWEVRQIRELVKYYIGGGWGNETSNSDFNVGAFVIRGTDIPSINNGSYLKNIFRFHKPSNYKSRKIQAGDLIFEVSGGSKNQLLGRSCLITDRILEFYDKRLICASFCKLIRASDTG